MPEKCMENINFRASLKYRGYMSTLFKERIVITHS